MVNLEQKLIRHFILFDDDGTIIISDEGGAYLGFDGYSTYVVRGFPFDESSFKSWRFRTNISPSGGSTLKKTASGIAALPWSRHQEAKPGCNCLILLEGAFSQNRLMTFHNLFHLRFRRAVFLRRLLSLKYRIVMVRLLRRK